MEPSSPVENDVGNQTVRNIVTFAEVQTMKRTLRKKSECGGSVSFFFAIPSQCSVRSLSPPQR